MRRFSIAAFIFTVLLIGLNSCKKQIEISSTIPKEIKVDESKVFVKPSTPEEKLLVQNLGKITSVIKEVYKNKEAIAEVNIAILSKTYTDQSVLIKDLIYPGKGFLAQSDKYKNKMAKLGITIGTFSKLFWKEAQKLNDPEFITFLTGLNNFESNMRMAGRLETDGLTDLTIYAPYEENFMDDTGGGTYYYAPMTSIATATADADEGIGDQPIIDVVGNIVGYQQVLINDAYCEANPTVIIGLNGVEPYFEPDVPYKAFPPGDPIDLPTIPREVKQVYVGDIRINNHQFDKLISFTGNGGGSEIVFTRSDGYLLVNSGQVQANNFFNRFPTITRKQINHSWWVSVASEFDGDWEAANFQQFVACYEEDNRNEHTLTATLSTTLTASVPIPPATIGQTLAGTIGSTVKYYSDDELIFQTKIYRDVFFQLNRIDLEGEMYFDWPVKNKNGLVSYTYNDRTFY